MANHAARILAPFWYEPEDGNGLKFKLRGLTGIQVFDVNAHAVHGDGGSITWGAAGARAALRFGLLGWEGFNDADGQPVEFGKDFEKNIAKLDFLLANELFAKILEASSLGAEAAKN